MSQGSKLKIVVVGPQRVGKSALANFLADQGDVPAAEYAPTVGVRILEVYKPLGATNTRTLVEIWDVSGDRRFEPMWPAIQKDADGLLLVYNPANKAHEREIEIWYRAFAGPLNLRETQCQLFAHHTQPYSLPAPPRPKLGAKALAKVTACHTSIEADASMIRDEFLRFLQRCAVSLDAGAPAAGSAAPRGAGTQASG